MPAGSAAALICDTGALIDDLVEGLDPDPPRVVFETDFVDTPGVSYDVSPDGQRLLIVKPAGRPVVQSQISLVVNWPAIVK